MKATLTSDPLDFDSMDFETDLPGHCYVCHIAAEKCGPHCDGKTLGGSFVTPEDARMLVAYQKGRTEWEQRQTSARR